MRLEPGESPSPGIRLRDAAPGDAPFLKQLAGETELGRQHFAQQMERLKHRLALVPR